MLSVAALLQITRTLVSAGFYLASSVSVITLAALYIFQRKLVYPSSLNNARGNVDTPDKYGLPYEEIKIKTADGENLQTFLLLHDQNDLNYSNKTILILSPNAGNIGLFLPVVQHLYQNLNYNVLIYSYRGYGHSTGSPNEKGLKLDADAVMKFISSHKQLSQSSIITYGRSLGGAIAVYITANYGDQISGMILENTFLNLPKVVPHIFPFLKYVSWLCSEYWNTEDEIKRISPDIPCLFLAGTKDEIVPHEHMKILYETVGENQPDRTCVKIWRDFNSNHNSTIVAPGYWDTWEQFAKEMVVPIGK